MRHPEDLRASVALLAVVVLIALVGLGLAGNWPKVLRVALAAITYSGTLLVLSSRRPLRPEPFMLAGALAGLVSGLLRTDSSAEVVVASVLGASLLLAPLHWLAVRSRQRAGSIP